MLRILFVDDESHILEGLQRLLRGMRKEWQMEFVTSGALALETLSRGTFDVIVSDMRMPVMNGAVLLARVRDRYPHMFRLTLSGHADQEEIVKTVGVTHQFISKPCDPETLKQAILRASSLRGMLRDESLKKAIASLSTLPSLPSLYLELQAELMSENSNVATISRVVSKDIGMTAKILQLVNSAFFGLPRQVGKMSDAISLLGVATLQSLVLSSQAFSQFDPESFPGMSVDSLWDHSVATSVLARRIAEIHKCGDPMAGQAFLAGLLHELGTLVLVSADGQKHQEVLRLCRQDRLHRFEAERRLYGCTHAEAGAYLLGLWGLPDPIVEALAYHDHPIDCVTRQFSPLTAVHVANVLVEEGKPDREGMPIDPLSHEYLDALGVTQELPAWREACASLQVASEIP
ncbi:MAG TPA: response regulator [Planctomycetota bacterium]|nr:response regulator [Planctomycetota bacterium]